MQNIDGSIGGRTVNDNNFKALKTAAKHTLECLTNIRHLIFDRHENANELSHLDP